MKQIQNSSEDKNLRLHALLLFLIVLTLRQLTDRLGVLLAGNLSGAGQALVIIGSQILWLIAPIFLFLAVKRFRTMRLEHTGWRTWLFSLLLAVCVTFALTYLEFGLRGIVLAAVGRVAIRQPVGAVGFGTALLLVLGGCLIPATGMELISKSCLYEGGRRSRGFACAAALILPLLLYQDPAYMALLLCFGLCTLFLYARCRNVALTGSFLAVCLLPNSVAGGRTWLPFDYRSSLSVEGTLLNALTALGIALILAAACIVLFGLIARETKGRKPFTGRAGIGLRFEEGLTIVLIVTIYAAGIVWNLLI